MTSLLLLLALAAPKAPPDAEIITWLPRIDALAPTLPFFRAAGTRSLLLRPESWREQAEPLLELDLTSADSLALAGVDGTASLTSSRLADRSYTCLSLSDPKLFAKRTSERLSRLGTLFTKTDGAITITAARDPIERVLAAVATSGKEACTLVGHGLSVEKQLPLLARVLGKPLQAPGVALAGTGPVSFIVPQGARHGALTLAAKDLSLTLDARTKGLPLAATAGAGPSPYGALAGEGMLVLRARFARSAMPQVLDLLVKQLPMGAALAGAAKALAPLLTGNAALVVSHVKVTSGLRSPLARLFALRFAVVAEVTDAAAARLVVEGVDPKLLASREGQLDVATADAAVVLSNDPDVKKRLLAALATAAGKQAHGVEFVVSPSLVARGLAQVPLLEAVQAPELAGLLAASSELGPLLLATERVTGWVDAPGGTQRGQLSWVLNPAKFVPDALDGGAAAPSP